MTVNKFTGAIMTTEMQRHSCKKPDILKLYSSSAALHI